MEVHPEECICLVLWPLVAPLKGLLTEKVTDNLIERYEKLTQFESIESIKLTDKENKENKELEEIEQDAYDAALAGEDMLSDIPEADEVEIMNAPRRGASAVPLTPEQKKQARQEKVLLRKKVRAVMI